MTTGQDKELARLVEEDIVIQDVMLKDIDIGGEWQELMEIDIPAEVKVIRDQQQVYLTLGVEDRAIWTATSSGSFSIASSWEQLRKKREVTRVEAKVWQKLIPFKKSFVTWRALHDRLPTDSKIAKFGRNLEAKCHCCVSPMLEMESKEHLFCSGNFAREI